MNRFFQTTRDNAAVFKVVVTSSGDLTAHDYNIEEEGALQEGDVGLHLRVDFGDTGGELAPAQVEALSQIAEHVATSFLGSCSVEPAGFSPGEIVKLDDGTNCLIVQDKGAIIRVKIVNAQGKLVRRTLHSVNVEDVPVEQNGVVGLLLQIGEEGKLIFNFIDISQDPNLVHLAMKTFASREDGEDEWELIHFILSSDSPFAYYQALKVTAFRGGKESKEKLRAFAVKYSDHRCADLYAQLVIYDSRIKELDMNLSGRKDLLEKIVTQRSSGRPELVYQAAGQHGQSFQGRAKALLKALSVFIEQGKFDLFLATCKMLKEDGVEFEIPAYDEPDSAGMSNYWRIEASIEGEPMSLEGLLAGRAVWPNDQLEVLLSLRSVVKAPDAFWRIVEHGFDAKSTDQHHFVDCMRLLRNSREKLVFLRWVISTGMFENGPANVEFVQELFLSVMDNDGEEEAKEVVQLQAVKLIEPLKLYQCVEAISHACLPSVLPHATKAFVNLGVPQERLDEVFTD